MFARQFLVIFHVQLSYLSSKIELVLIFIFILGHKTNFTWKCPSLNEILDSSLSLLLYFSIKPRLLRPNLYKFRCGIRMSIGHGILLHIYILWVFLLRRLNRWIEYADLQKNIALVFYNWMTKRQITRQMLKCVVCGTALLA